MEWSVESYKEKPAVQEVAYKKSSKSVLEKLAKLPPIVHPNEIDSLKSQLAECALGQRFLLQGGDCAELFDYCSSSPIESKLKVLLQMSLILVWGGRTKVVRIARMGGQYGIHVNITIAKPRSNPMETVNGVQVNSFRGDNVNGNDINDREPDPDRLLQAYFHSTATVNYVRSLLDNGFANLFHPDSWNLDSWNLQHVRSPLVKSEYQNIVDRLLDSLDFMRTIDAAQDRGGISSPHLDASLSRVDMFMSHEGLLLDYEAQLTRPITKSIGGITFTKHYNLGAHFLWIGDRTRQITGAHVEYFRGVANPIGLKVGPSIDTDELVRLLDILNPDKEVGKVTLITRYGAAKIQAHLPDQIKAVQKSGHKVVWCCDPMHGNTETSGAYKTRKFENIVSELSRAFRIHKDHGSQLNGVHCELTGDRVTECVGGTMELGHEELSSNYQTFCDPRLNYEQSLDVAFLISKWFEGERKIGGL